MTHKVEVSVSYGENGQKSADFYATVMASPFIKIGCWVDGSSGVWPGFPFFLIPPVRKKKSGPGQFQGLTTPSISSI